MAISAFHTVSAGGELGWIVFGGDGLVRSLWPLIVAITWRSCTVGGRSRGGDAIRRRGV